MTYMMAINPDEMRVAIKEKMSLMAMSVAGMLALSYPALRDKKKRTK